MTLPLADIAAVLPELIVVAAACLVLTLEPITAPAKKPWLAWFSLAILVVCFGITAGRLGTHATAFSDRRDSVVERTPYFAAGGRPVNSVVSSTKQIGFPERSCM